MQLTTGKYIYTWYDDTTQHELPKLCHIAKNKVQHACYWQKSRQDVPLLPSPCPFDTVTWQRAMSDDVPVLTIDSWPWYLRWMISFHRVFPHFPRTTCLQLMSSCKWKKVAFQQRCLPENLQTEKKKTRHTQPRSTIETTIIPSLDFWQDVGCPHVTCCFHPLFCTKPPSCNAAWLITSHSAKSNSTLFMTCQNVIVWHILPKCHLNLWWM